MQPLPFRSTLTDYEAQAAALLAAWRAGDACAVQLFRQCHPRFLDEVIKWLPKQVSDAEILAAALGLDDARLATARGYSFQSWSRLAEWADAVAKKGSPVERFESAVEAVINGDAATLQRLLQEHPNLVTARSTIVTCYDPPVHRATLLHYVAANGVEGYRQKSPPNAAEIARLLLDAGADADALADMYGGECTTMSLLVSSSHPAEAGVQVALVDTLVDYGAAVDPRGSGNWTSPLMTALIFGYPQAAEALVRRGARVDRLAAVAGLGRVDDVRQLLPTADGSERHIALAIAAQLGHVEVARLLLDAGEDPNRYNPKGHHAHATPLHQAVCFGHEPMVRLLVERGARLDTPDTIYKSTPLGWAEHCGQPEIAAYLRSRQS
jgi:ankyrin repeat protein